MHLGQWKPTEVPYTRVTSLNEGGYVRGRVHSNCCKLFSQSQFTVVAKGLAASPRQLEGTTGIRCLLGPDTTTLP